MATALRNLIASWPLLRQISTGADGTGPESLAGTALAFLTSSSRRTD